MIHGHNKIWFEFCRIYSWTPPSELYFLVIQISIAFVALRRISGARLGQDLRGDSCLECFCSSRGYIGWFKFSMHDKVSVRYLELRIVWLPCNCILVSSSLRINHGIDQDSSIKENVT